MADANINDKMIGAYAYGWFFNVEPIAGVTPIKHMLDDMKRPVPKVLAPMIQMIAKTNIWKARVAMKSTPAK